MGKVKPAFGALKRRRDSSSDSVSSQSSVVTKKKVIAKKGRFLDHLQKKRKQQSVQQEASTSEDSEGESKQRKLSSSKKKKKKLEKKKKKEKSSEKSKKKKRKTKSPPPKKKRKRTPSTSSDSSESSESESEEEHRIKLAKKSPAALRKQYRATREPDIEEPTVVLTTSPGSVLASRRNTRSPESLLRQKFAVKRSSSPAEMLDGGKKKRPIEERLGQKMTHASSTHSTKKSSPIVVRTDSLMGFMKTKASSPSRLRQGLVFRRLAARGGKHSSPRRDSSSSSESKSSSSSETEAKDVPPRRSPVVARIPPIRRIVPCTPPGTPPARLSPVPVAPSDSPAYVPSDEDELVLTWPPPSSSPSPPRRQSPSPSPKAKTSPRKKSQKHSPIRTVQGPELPPPNYRERATPLSSTSRRFTSPSGSPRVSPERDETKYTSDYYYRRKSDSYRRSDRSPSPRSSRHRHRERERERESLPYVRRSKSSSLRRRESRSPSPPSERRKPSPIRALPPSRWTSTPQASSLSSLTVHNVVNLNLNIHGTPTEATRRTSVFSRLGGTPGTPNTSLTPDKLADQSLEFRSPAVQLAKLMPVRMDVPYVDSHMHLDFIFSGQRGNSFSSFDEMCREMLSQYAQFRGGVTIFCKPQLNAIESTWRFLDHPCIYGAVGCHPHFAKDFKRYGGTEQLRFFLIQKRGLKAIGEIGLDNPDYGPALTEEQVQVQKDVFRECLQLAVDMRLPVVIHIRNAEKDAFEICQEVLPKNHPIHLHCFNYKWYIAKRWLDAYPNAYVGITPMITYPNRNGPTQDLAANIPLEKLLLESDSPYFVPQQVKSTPLGRRLGSSEEHTPEGPPSVDLAQWRIHNLKEDIPDSTAPMRRWYCWMRRLSTVSDAVLQPWI
ncbi:unnamed protein product [Cyprideis torosa]|uniref:Uncharacterized protein n=1 Tax=Cyprideis torosa TaxID=163714 RepID=A0A7R8ZHN9_9CRUS|nr:unnamed protein product [Cyprideis torosa]CAG0884170.1 unnamed protein product [Cyprideis torosa]